LQAFLFSEDCLLYSVHMKSDLELLIPSLKDVFSGDIETSEEILEKYSRDASMFKIIPQMVVFPKNSADIQKLVKWTNEQNESRGEKLNLTVRSAGTCMAGGAINDSIIIDVTRYMHDVISVTSEYAVVQPGCYYRDFEPKTLEKNVIFPSYTASRELCALGGMYGNNCAGEKTLKYGKFNEYILSSKVIFSDGNEYIVEPLNRPQLEEKMKSKTFEGELYRSIWELIQNNGSEIINAKPIVSKNSAGYAIWNVWNAKTQIFDLNQLLIGSQGTLGIVTEMKIRLVPVEPVTAMMVTFLPDLKNLGDLVNMCKTVNPTSIESFDDYSLTFAFKFFTDFVKQLGLLGGARLGLRFIPEAFMMMRTGIPKLILMTEVTGNNQDELLAQLHSLEKEIKTKFGYRSRVMKHNEAEKYWKIRRESFNLLRKHVKGLHTAPFIDDVVIPVEHLSEFLPKIQNILDREKFIYTIAGHAGNGNFHIIPLLDFKKEGIADQVMRLSDEVYDVIASYHGSITGEHNDGIVRTPYLGKQFDAGILKLFSSIKKIFDKQNILNPNKKVNGNIEMIQKYLIKE
jgi:FAD/FMN-containing dehydrogenase